MSPSTAEAVAPPAPIHPQDLEKASAEERVHWAVANFGDRLIMSTSFGVKSAVLLHLVTQIQPELPVVFIDTGYLIPETYRFAQELTTRLKLNLKTYTPTVTAARMEALHGKLWEGEAKSDAQNLYKFTTKQEPMNRAVRELRAKGWLAGLLRVQSSTREERGVVELQNKTTKIYPLIDWSNRMIYRYLQKYDLPYHPLFEQGYVSVGDWHSTRKLEPGMTEEDTRGGADKRECGLHEPGTSGDFSI